MIMFRNCILFCSDFVLSLFSLLCLKGDKPTGQPASKERKSKEQGNTKKKVDQDVGDEQGRDKSKGKEQVVHKSPSKNDAQVSVFVVVKHRNTTLDNTL